jgi:hypothetical protein
MRNAYNPEGSRQASEFDGFFLTQAGPAEKPRWLIERAEPEKIRACSVLNNYKIRNNSTPAQMPEPAWKGI